MTQSAKTYFNCHFFNLERQTIKHQHSISEYALATISHSNILINKICLALLIYITIIILQNITLQINEAFHYNRMNILRVIKWLFFLFFYLIYNISNINYILSYNEWIHHKNIKSTPIWRIIYFNQIREHHST